MSTESLELPYGVKNLRNGGSSNIDTHYGHYASISEACVAVPLGVRKGGRTVGILTSEGKVEEYWWRDDSALDDEDLEVKTPDMSSKVDKEDGKGLISDVDNTKLSFITITQAVNLDDLETRVNELDAAIILKGVWNASTNVFPGSGNAQAGWSYLVAVDGVVDGIEFKNGDRLICVKDDASTTTYANNWYKADYTDRVNTVAGRTGNVVITSSDLSDFNTAVNALIAIGIAGKQNTLTASNFGTFTTDRTTKSSPIDADIIGYVDSVTGNWVKITMQDLKRVLKNDTLKEVNANYILLQADSTKVVYISGNNRVITVPADLVAPFSITVKVKGTGATIIDNTETLNGDNEGLDTTTAHTYALPKNGIVIFTMLSNGTIDVTGDIV